MIKSGDQVRLKSGGPTMTVRNEDYNNPNEVWVDWFDSNGNNCQASYNKEQLEPISVP